MQPSQSPKPVAPIRSADTYSPRHSAVTTETKGVISRCQVGPSQAVIVVPDRVDTARLVLTGAEGVDPLDSHIKLAQLKTAAAIALLHNETTVTAQAWEMAGQLIDVSAQVRERLRGALADRARRENTARALDQADREAIVRERLAEDAQRRVARAITRKLTAVGTATKHDLRTGCHSSIRADFETVFDMFIDKGFIVSNTAGEDGHAARYRLANE